MGTSRDVEIVFGGETGRPKTAKCWQQKSGAQTVDDTFNDGCCRTGVSVFRRNHCDFIVVQNWFRAPIKL